MGWQDRKYSSESYDESAATTRGLRRPPTVTLILMILHGAAFFLMLAMQEGEGQEAAGRFGLGGREGPASGPLGILLHPIATGNLLSILFVVLAFWSLGGRLEPRLGPLRFAGVYVIGNLAAGVAYFGVARAQPGLAAAALDYPVGALAGLCLAAWQHLRHDSVQLLGRITTAGKVYAICGAIVAGLVLLRAGAGGSAWLVAAAAGAASAVLIVRWPVLRGFAGRRRVIRPSIPRSKVRRPIADGGDIDEILAKIGKSGLDSLTEAERQRLEAARQAKLRRPK